MFKRLAVLSVIALWPCTAQGQWYIGAGLGQAEFDRAIPFDFPPDTASNDSTDLTWKLFGGYRFTKNFAVEFGTADLGDQSIELNGQDIDVWGVALVYRFKSAG